MNREDAKYLMVIATIAAVGLIICMYLAVGPKDCMVRITNLSDSPIDVIILIDAEIKGITTIAPQSTYELQVHFGWFEPRGFYDKMVTVQFPNTLVEKEIASLVPFVYEG